jgi:hypothetical protein
MGSILSELIADVEDLGTIIPGHKASVERLVELVPRLEGLVANAEILFAGAKAAISPQTPAASTGVSTTGGVTLPAAVEPAAEPAGVTLPPAPEPAPAPEGAVDLPEPPAPTAAGSGY